jgi:hypothetical protein
VVARVEMPVAITSTGVFGCKWENATCRYGHTFLRALSERFRYRLV